MNYKISRKAQEDLESIWHYTFENWSIDQADRYINLIFDELEYISKHPLNGKDFGEIRKYYRYVKVKAHLIFYKHVKNQDKIEIIRILHERMDLDSRLK